MFFIIALVFTFIIKIRFPKEVSIATIRIMNSLFTSRQKVIIYFAQARHFCSPIASHHSISLTKRWVASFLLTHCLSPFYFTHQMMSGVIFPDQINRGDKSVSWHAVKTRGCLSPVSYDAPALSRALAPSKRHSNWQGAILSFCSCSKIGVTMKLWPMATGRRLLRVNVPWKLWHVLGKRFQMMCNFSNSQSSYIEL